MADERLIIKCEHALNAYLSSLIQSSQKSR